MKLGKLVKIVTVSAVVLISVTLVGTLYYRINQTGKAEDFDLYSLVPNDALAIIDTNNMIDLFGQLNELSCSKDGHFLHFSHLFSQLKEHINTLIDETPHGFSKQMNKLLISFHEPDNMLNQVFYCRLGVGDKELVEEFVRKYCTSSFPSKYFDYKGQEIRIYPMADDTFLACYITQEFLAISYQKKLIENVIDAHLTNTSILSDPLFPDVTAAVMPRIPAKIYVRMQPLNMGKESDKLRSDTNLGGWTEFTMGLNSHAIYFSGVNNETDSVMSFVNTLRKQEPITEFPGDILPATTFYFNRVSISDIPGMFAFTSSHNFARKAYPDNIKNRDMELIDFLREYSGNSITACMFHALDTLDDDPCVVLNVPVKNSGQAERFFRNLIKTIPKGELGYAHSDNFFYHTFSGGYRFIPLPNNSIITQLTGVTDLTGQPFACFYRNSLLMASDSRSLQSYVDSMESGTLLEDNIDYKESIVSLSDSYNFLMMTDLGKAFEQPEAYSRLIPDFFIRHNYFFRYFIFSAQFTCVDDVIYPNVVLIYKGEEFVEEELFYEELPTDSIE